MEIRTAEGPTAIRIYPASAPLKGRVSVPGSKSITNRALLLAALASGKSCLTGALSSYDTIYMADALRSMGVEISPLNGAVITVVGTGQLQAPSGPLFLGNAGTALRFLMGAAATVNGAVVIDGDEHMRRRPIGPLTIALRSLGINAQDTAGYPPVQVESMGGFLGTKVKIDGNLSSQYVSAVLMASACGTQSIEVSIVGSDIGGRGYVDITVQLMKMFGAKIAATGPASWLVEPTGYKATNCNIEADASSSTYLWAAEVLTGGDIDLGIIPAEMIQPDARAHKVISMFPHLPTLIDGSQMQDAIPTLAVLAAFNETPVRFTGLANLRVKECDRISALINELSRILPGLAREEGNDLIVFSDPSIAGRTLPAEIRTYSDHRIAMSFALAGLEINGITILDPGCVAKTYPQFWRDLESIGATLEFL